MEKKGKKVWGLAAGLLDPVLRNWAQKIAAGISPDSMLRSDVFNAAMGSLKGLVEVLGEGLPPAASVLVEKITDFSDFFTGALGAKTRKVAGPVIKGWMNKFFDEAGTRLEKAADPQKEFEKIEVEFKLRLALLKLIEEATKTPAEDETPKVEIDWEGWRRKFSDLVITWWPRIKSGLKTADQKTAKKLRQVRGWLAMKGVS